MNKTLKTAFTLVELLVVIAIVGILSGLIIVGMNSSIQQATLAKAQIFSASLRDSLLADLISEWKLDESSGSVAANSWGSSNQGTLSENGYAGSCDATHCPQWQTSGCMYGNCLKFDGSNDYVDCGTGLNTPSGVTIDVWVKPSALPSDSGSYFGIVGKTSGFGASLVVDSYAGSGKGYMFIADAGNVRANGEAYTGLNIWKNVIGTYDGTNLKIYVNGVLKGTQAFAVSQTSNSMYFGRVTGYGYFNGMIDNVRVYDSAIPTSQIESQYYAGLNRLLLKGGISYNEYIKRIKNNI